MKLKINKACDLSSISVLPHARKSSAVPSGRESSVFGKSHPSQLRSQPSQQSFSQGVSSQHGMFSQLSQNSLDEIVTNDQRSETNNGSVCVLLEGAKRIVSQERENSVKRISCLPPISHTREENQIPISRSSTNLIHKWNPASVADHKCQINEELEHRIRIMETSLNRFGMILDSVQSDIMQVNKGTKEVLMEMEAIRQKLIANDSSLQLMNKGQEDIKTNLVGELKSISDQASWDIHQEKLKEILSMISALPKQIDVCFQKFKSELCHIITQEMEAIPCSLRISGQNHRTPSMLLAKGISCHATSQQMPPLKNSKVHQEVCRKETLIPNMEVGSWTSVKKEHDTFAYGGSSKEHKQKRMPPIELEREWKVVIESDEEIDGGFSCLLEKNNTGIGNFSMAEAKEETERIMRKARRRKRKYCNPIVLD